MCNGLVFRFYRTTYMVPSSGGFALKEEFKLLKKKSCEGCKECGLIRDDIREGTILEVLDWSTLDLEDRDLVTIRVGRVYWDCESGLVDDFDLELVKLEEENG